MQLLVELTSGEAINSTTSNCNSWQPIKQPDVGRSSSFVFSGHLCSLLLSNCSQTDEELVVTSLKQHIRRLATCAVALPMIFASDTPLVGLISDLLLLLKRYLPSTHRRIFWKKPECRLKEAAFNLVTCSSS